MPGALDNVLGLINLRGTVTPIFDLRRYFGLPTQVGHATTNTVVLRVGRTDLGLAVDEIIGVLASGALPIEPSTAMLHTAAADQFDEDVPNAVEIEVAVLHPISASLW